MRQIVLDTETTGLDWRNGDRVIEIGCVELLNRSLTGRHFHVYINPERGIDAEAVAVHGITEEFLADKPKFARIVSDFEDFVRDAELVIHNASFDVGFLDSELERLDGFNWVNFAECHDSAGDLNLHHRLPAYIDPAAPDSPRARALALLAGGIALTVPGFPMLPGTSHLFGV